MPSAANALILGVKAQHVEIVAVVSRLLRRVAAGEEVIIARASCARSRSGSATSWRISAQTERRAVGTLPSHHRDPFDRLLISQAQILDVRIHTADRQFAPYEVTVRRAK